MAELKNDEELSKRFDSDKIIDERNGDKKFLYASIDCETDPFGERDADNKLLDVEPFSWGIEIENGEYHEFWGDDSTEQVLNFLANYPFRLKMFAHNGGKFDYIYFLRMGVITGEPRIINGRIVEAKILNDRHIIRDSFAMLPVPLSALGDGEQNKIEIDYDKMRRENREKYKDEILQYLKMDCSVLLNIVLKFIAEFGDKLTIGSAALAKLKEFHPFEKIDIASDEVIRPYYIGGRVQHFRDGEIKGDIKVYDVNSMYPYVMKEKDHPTFVGHFKVENPPLDCIDDKGVLPCGSPYFITVVGEFIGELGHFPVRTKSGLDFSVMSGEYKITHHELQTALKYNQFRIDEIKEIIICPQTINFDTFVVTYIERKIYYSMPETENPAMRLFVKLVLNSAYGKLGQNPLNFRDYMITESWDEMTVAAINEELLEDDPDADLWVLKETNHLFNLWEKIPDNVSESFNDCFVAASITGASRAVLMEAIITAKNPLYCDTDSVICESLDPNHIEFDPNKLGAWDLEATGDTVYIYGKKVYSLYKDGAPYRDKKGKEKTANKGVKMNAQQIRDLVMGENLQWSAEKQAYVYRWENEAPTYSLDGSHKFMHRELVAKNFSQKGLRENRTGI
jgi:hypothetical protein